MIFFVKTLKNDNNFVTFNNIIGCREMNALDNFTDDEKKKQRLKDKPEAERRQEAALELQQLL